ncbi:hypothetical protein Tco_0894263, partial [Tanacetum coccineum]
HDALNSQDAEPTFYKRSHDNQDSPNNREGENKKKRRKDVALRPRDEYDFGLVKIRDGDTTSGSAVLTEAKRNSDEDEVLVCPSTKEKYTTSITKDDAARYYKQDRKIDFFKAEMSTRTKGNVYSDLRIKSVVHVVVKKKWGYGFLSLYVVRRSDDQEYEFSYANLPKLNLNDVEDMYLLQLQDKLYHLPLEFVKDFNNALLLFIRRVVIHNRVEDIQLRVESYKQTLNLTKPMMFFEGIDQRIPFIMSGTHKGVVFLNQHNFKSFMKLSGMKKFYDCTLVKIQENLIDMVTKNKLGTGPLRCRFPWCKDVSVDRRFWESLVCLDPPKKGWIMDEHIELWVNYMWHVKPYDANWAMVGGYFVQLLLQDSIPLWYADGTRYKVAWSDVDELHIRTGVVTFYDIGVTYNLEWPEWYIILRDCLKMPWYVVFSLLSVKHIRHICSLARVVTLNIPLKTLSYDNIMAMGLVQTYGHHMSS